MLHPIIWPLLSVSVKHTTVFLKNTQWHQIWWKRNLFQFVPMQTMSENNYHQRVKLLLIIIIRWILLITIKVVTITLLVHQPFTTGQLVVQHRKWIYNKHPMATIIITRWEVIQHQMVHHQFLAIQIPILMQLQLRECLEILSHVKCRKVTKIVKY